MDDANIFLSEGLQTDDAKKKELLDVYHQKIADVERAEILSHDEDPGAPLDPKVVPILAYGLVSEIKEAMGSWQMKKEVTFENKTYRTFSTTSTNADGASKLTFIEVKLIFNKPEDSLPIEASITETRPDDNGTLHERHFAAKLGNETTAQLQFVQYPYKQVEAGTPSINMSSIVVVGRKMVQLLARSL